MKSAPGDDPRGLCIILPIPPKTTSSLRMVHSPGSRQARHYKSDIFGHRGGNIPNNGTFRRFL